MKGYKGMNSDMTCRGMKYEIGKTYHEDNIELCKSGLHFCKNLHNVFDYYQRGKMHRFFEVEAVGKVIMGGDKCVTDTLTIVRELSEIEVNRNYYSSCNGFACEIVNGLGNGFGNGFGYNVDWSSDYCNDYAFGDGYGDGTGNNLSTNNAENIHRSLIFKEV